MNALLTSLRSGSLGGDLASLRRKEAREADEKRLVFEKERHFLSKWKKLSKAKSSQL